MAEDRIHLNNLGPGDVALLKDIAEAAADKAVAKTFLAMGLDTNSPLAAQRDFSVLRDIAENVRDDAFRSDMDWVRKTRTRMDGIIGKVIFTAVGLAVLGALNAAWTGFKQVLR